MNYDRELSISVGGSRKATSWAQTRITWAELAGRLRTPIRGRESHETYLRMPKGQQDNLKDVGGFVGGTLRGGRRKAANVTGRDLITLDLDAIPRGGTEAALAAVSGLGCASCVYSTRKHEPDKPRLRVILPLDRTVTAEEYEPIARRVGEWLGIECCDPTTFQSFRLMYWPSASADSDFVYDLNDAPFLRADDALHSYQDWHNIAEWPQVPGQVAELRDAARTQADPTEKTGIIGVFCRAYDIRRAMDELIPGAYESTADPDRYTYTGGSTSGGAIVYDGKWLYSHHATDPCSGRLVNAWDLVRLHLYGDKDENARADTPANRLPSYKAMADYALQLDAVRLGLLDERRASLSQDFGTAPADGDWRGALAMNARGDTLGTLANLRLIMDNEPELAAFGQDAFLGQAYAYGPLPWNPCPDRRVWTDADDTGAAWYLETQYGIKDLRRVKMAVDSAIESRRRDALREYLEGLEWDGVPRVDTLLIRYFKAEDTPYTRAVTRKFLTGAVARGMEPGCKFDSVLTLIGAQGTAKSLFADILGGAWYNDNIQVFTGKEASEQLRGVWIVEIPEVDRFSAKYESAAVKQFITRRDDVYRVPFERRTTPHPRRCVFIATTNAPDFLTDMTGNRRWWIIRCSTTADDRGEDMASLRRDRDLVWAEAVALWRAGEPLTLDGSLYTEAAQKQESAVAEDPWAGLIAEFAGQGVPPGWDAMPSEARLSWLCDDFGQHRAEGLRPRRRLCVMEIWCELLRRNRADLDGRTARRIAGLLRKLPGWAEIGPRQTVYGNQRCYYKLDDPATNSGACYENYENYKSYDFGNDIDN